jgi:hypothetical protein
VIFLRAAARLENPMSESENKRHYAANQYDRLKTPLMDLLRIVAREVVKQLSRIESEKEGLGENSSEKG